MHGKHRINWVALKQAVVNHALGTGSAFFCRLENKGNTAFEVGVFCDFLRGSQQHGHMAIVTTGMHFPGVAGGVRKLIAFLDGERVHVGSQADHFAWPLGSANKANHASTSNPGFHCVSKFSKPLGDDISGTVFFVTQFRVGVDVSTGIDPGFNFARIHNKLRWLVQALRIAGFAHCGNRCALL